LEKKTLLYCVIFKTKKIKKNRSDVIRTIQEISKLDEFTINQAIEACQDSEGRYSMDQVLNILMDEKYSNEQNTQRFQQTNPASASTPTTTSKSSAGTHSNNSTNYGENTKSEPIDVDENKDLMYSGSKNYSGSSNDRNK
jgi:hypothetical protein